MATNYFAKQNPTDIAIQSEDGGGMVFTKQGKFLFGAKLPDVNQQLNEEFFQGNVDIDPNTNSSYIGIMNAQSEPVNIDIPSTNQYSLFTPPDNVIVEPDPPKDDCDNEFNDIATVILTESNKKYSNFGFAKSKPNNLDQAKKLLLDYFWNDIKSSALDDGILSAVSSYPKEFIPKNLPPGLRNFQLFALFVEGGSLVRELLLTIGPDFLNIGGDSLGLPAYQISFSYDDKATSTKISDINGNLTDELVYSSNASNIPPGAKIYIETNKLINKYIEQFPQIIEAYNNNKVLFLETLKSVYTRGDNESRNKAKIFYKKKPNELKEANKNIDFRINLINLVYNTALKYINCPFDNQISPTTVLPDPNKSTESTTPKPPPPTSLTAAEIEEGIYEANFLPASEEAGAQLFDEILVKNLNDVIQNASNESSTSVKDVKTIRINISNVKSKSNGKIPKDGSEFKKYGSLFKIIQTTDVSDNLGNQVYYPAALFNQGDPLWGALSDGSYTMKGSGCAYVSFCMLITHYKNDPGYTPQWMWDNASTSIVTYWSKLAKAAGATAVKEDVGTMARIDELLQTKPVEFEWIKKRARDNGYTGESYAYGKQHWMVIVGRNSDGTYTIFDPSGGKIRSNVSASSIEAGLGAIVYIN